MLTKEAADAAVKRDSNNAFLEGFKIAAAQCGVETEAQFTEFHKAGMELQAKLAAAPKK